MKARGQAAVLERRTTVSPAGLSLREKIRPKHSYGRTMVGLVGLEPMTFTMST